MRMCWILFVLLVFFMSLNLNVLCEGGSVENNNKKKIVVPAAVVVGTVFCDTCFQQHLSKTPHFISGATVAVECRDGETSKTSFHEQVKTNKKGKFRVILPLSIAKHVNKIKNCSVKLIKSSEPFCSVASSATSSVLHFKSNNKKGTKIFSAGFFTFKPLDQPTFCTQKPTNKKIGIRSIESVLPPFDSPVLPSPVLPKIPDLPPLPPLIPGLPPPDRAVGERKSNPQLLFPPVLPPNPFQPPSMLPPNPLLPPPLIPNPLQPPAPVIPNPFQPPAPIIPNPFQPPPAPILPNPFQPLPPIPLFTPPPPPPSLFPPFLPPLPVIPGIPSGPPREETSLPSKLESP